MNLTPEQYLALVAKQKRGKYNVKPREERTVDDIVFDSAREANRYGELKLLERAGKIRDLTLQPSFALLVNGVSVGKYSADFYYKVVADASEVVEDVKPKARHDEKGRKVWDGRTAVYKLKRKLVAAIHGVKIVEV